MELAKTSKTATRPAVRDAYADALTAAEAVSWRPEELLRGRALPCDAKLLPEALVATEDLTLSAAERRSLNRVRARSYLHILALIGSFTIPFVLDYARPRLGEDDTRTRALLLLASERAKHRQLFLHLRDACRGTRSSFIGPRDAIVRSVLAHHPLSVALLIMHLDLVTTAHAEAAAADHDLDADMAELLRRHAAETREHARLEELIVRTLAKGADPVERTRALDDYLELVDILDDDLAAQTERDVQAFEATLETPLRDAERAALSTHQKGVVRRIFIHAGMTQRDFGLVLDHIDPAWSEHVARRAAHYR